MTEEHFWNLKPWHLVIGRVETWNPWDKGPHTTPQWRAEHSPGHRADPQVTDVPFPVPQPSVPPFPQPVPCLSPFSQQDCRMVQRKGLLSPPQTGDTPTPNTPPKEQPLT